MLQLKKNSNYSINKLAAATGARGALPPVVAGCSKNSLYFVKTSPTSVLINVLVLCVFILHRELVASEDLT